MAQKLQHILLIFTLKGIKLQAVAKIEKGLLQNDRHTIWRLLQLPLRVIGDKRGNFLDGKAIIFRRVPPYPNIDPIQDHENKRPFYPTTQQRSLPHKKNNDTPYRQSPLCKIYF